MALQLQSVSGRDILPYRDALASLRIQVFREYPYLYEGDFDYEREYLEVYWHCPRSLCVLAQDGDEVVGASTAMPLAEESEEFKTPFRKQGIPLETVFYFGESVLLPQYRGQGIGHAFFDRREAFARQRGSFEMTVFCAVERPAHDPRKPAHFRSLEPFWRKRGYEKHPELQARFTWKEIGEPAETGHTLTFWLRGIPRG